MALVDIIYMANISQQDFKNFFKYYKSEAQQEAGVEILFDQMRDVLKERWARLDYNISREACCWYVQSIRCSVSKSEW